MHLYTVHLMLEERANDRQRDFEAAQLDRPHPAAAHGLASVARPRQPRSRRGSG